MFRVRIQFRQRLERCNQFVKSRQLDGARACGLVLLPTSPVLLQEVNEAQSRYSNRQGG